MSFTWYVICTSTRQRTRTLVRAERQNTHFNIHTHAFPCHPVVPGCLDPSSFVNSIIRLSYIVKTPAFTARPWQRPHETLSGAPHVHQVTRDYCISKAFVRGARQPPLYGVRPDRLSPGTSSRATLYTLAFVPPCLPYAHCPCTQLPTTLCTSLRSSTAQRRTPRLTLRRRSGSLHHALV